MQTNKSTHEILSLSLEPNDAYAATIGEYLSRLLTKLWTEEEGFSSKRPFGESGWKSAISIALIRAGLVKGEIDEDGCITRADKNAVDEIILDCIEEVFSK